MQDRFDRFDRFKVVQCTLATFFPLFIALGNYAQKFLAGNGLIYIVIPYEITPDIRAILLTHHTIASPITDEIQKLEDSTPMTLRLAIQHGRLKHPGWKYQHLWDAVCKKAGIVELPYAQQVANVALTVGLYALLGAVKAGEAFSSFRK
jgi:hypothetical protein